MLEGFESLFLLFVYKLPPFVSRTIVLAFDQSFELEKVLKSHGKRADQYVIVNPKFV